MYKQPTLGEIIKTAHKEKQARADIKAMIESTKSVRVLFKMVVLLAKHCIAVKAVKFLNKLAK